MYTQRYTLTKLMQSTVRYRDTERPENGKRGRGGKGERLKREEISGTEPKNYGGERRKKVWVTTAMK